MRHLAVRARSLHSERAFTATGLGDRIHQLTCAWCYSQAHDEPVMLHMDARKLEGGQFGNKPESWREILKLFPSGWLGIQVHDVYPATEDEWLQHLDGVPVWNYGKDLDIVPYLKNIPRLSMPARHPLPDRFGTQQWDANAPSRQFPAVRFDISMITVGGAGQDPYRWSLRDIAAAMSKAELHAGVDSAFMHLAFLYLPMERIRLYTTGAESHHLKRARENGARVHNHH